MIKLMDDERLTIAHNIGYAVAVMEAFMQPQGTTGDKIKEALDGLNDAVTALSRESEQ